MPRRALLASVPLLPSLAGLAALLLLLGVVTAGGHVPVPLAPDATPAGGAQLATFALG